MRMNIYCNWFLKIHEVYVWVVDWIFFLSCLSYHLTWKPKAFPRRKQEKTHKVSFFNWELPELEYITFSPNTGMKIPFPSLRSSKLQVNIPPASPPAALVSPVRAVPGLCDRWHVWHLTRPQAQQAQLSDGEQHFLFWDYFSPGFPGAGESLEGCVCWLLCLGIFFVCFSFSSLSVFI